VIARAGFSYSPESHPATSGSTRLGSIRWYWIFRSIYDHPWMLYDNAETPRTRLRRNELKAAHQQIT
jgi:hypothetical protein